MKKNSYAISGTGQYLQVIMKLSVIIPVYNEEKTIEKTIDSVLERPEVKEIIAVNDGSTDASLKILQNFENKNSRVKIIHLNGNSGKGKAINEGLKHVSGDIILIQDADLEYNPEDYPKLLAPFSNPQVRVVYGSRLRKRGNRISYLSFAIGGILLTVLTDILYGARLTDEPTGYKVFRAGVLKSLDLRSRGFEFCPEVTAKILRQGIHIHEVPISYCPRKLSQGKKIRFRDGLIAIWTLLKYRFVK